MSFILGFIIGLFIGFMIIAILKVGNRGDKDGM